MYLKYDLISIETNKNVLLNTDIMKYLHFLSALLFLLAVPAQAQFVATDQLQINTDIPQVTGEEIILQGQVTDFVFNQQQTLLSINTSNGRWQLSAPSAVELRRLGWTSGSLFVGEQVQVAVTRQLGLGNNGTLKHVTRANGAFLFTSLNSNEQQASFNVLKAGMYSLNRDYSQFHLLLDHQGFAQIGIQFEQISSDILWNSDSPETSIFQLDVDTASLSSGIPSIDTALKSRDFLNPTNYPKIRFRSTALRFQKWGDIEVDGQLEMNNSVQPVTLIATITKISIDHQSQQTKAGIKLKGSLNLSNWGLPTRSDLMGNTAEIELSGVFVLRGSESSTFLAR